MAEQISFLILGNGIAGITAAETLRAEVPNASIGVIADDDQPVYFRPALKDYLAQRIDEDKLWARPAGYYHRQHIHFLVDRVVRIIPDEHVVLLRGGGRVRYGRLLLATGAQATTLHCPGADLVGVTTLRTVADYQFVQEQLLSSRRIVVCGSGTLALETIETLRARGFQVTHLVRKRLLWSEVLDATASDLVLQEEQRVGVDIRLETEIVEVQGAHGAVTGVVTNHGDHIACELVLVAIGITPAVEYARASGIACHRGVLVDEQWRTNMPDIYAAGDILESVSRETRQGRLIGQWYPAIQQARAAVYSMLGLLDTARPFRIDTFYNATFLCGLPFASVGLTHAPQGYRELVADPQPRMYRKLIVHRDVLVGLLALGDRKQTLAFKRAIDYRVNVAAVLQELLATDFDVAGWLDQCGVPPLQLGVQHMRGTTRTSEVSEVSVSATKSAVATITDPEKEAVYKDSATARPVTAGSQLRQGVSEEEPVGENPMLDELNSSDHTEAFLVHIVDQQLPLRLAEAPLSRDTPTLIGRQPGVVDVVVNEASVSRRHAQISYHDHHFLLRDLDTLNGTYLNDERLESQRLYQLHGNDVICCGNVVKFRFLVRTLNLQELAASDGSASSPSHLSHPSRRVAKVRADGVIATSGMAQQLPPAVVNVLKKQPALIVLPPDVTLSEKQSPTVYPLQEESQTTIGRVKDNDIQLSDLVVSRHHAEVYATPAGFYVRDLGSSNGVLVNQSKIEQPYRLSHGDHIALGNTIIIFVDLQSGVEQTSHVRSIAPVAYSLSEERDHQERTAVPSGSGVAASSSSPVQGVSRSLEQSRRKRPTAALPGQMVTCPQCGLANMPSARFCASCSAQLHSA